MTDDPGLPEQMRLYTALVGITEQLLTHQLPDTVLMPLTETDDGIQLVIATRYGPDVIAATADALTLYTDHRDGGPPHGPLEAALRRTAALLAVGNQADHVRLGVALSAAIEAAVAGQTLQPDRDGPGGGGG